MRAKTMLSIGCAAAIGMFSVACGDGTTTDLLADQRPADATGAFTEKPVGFEMKLVDTSGAAAKFTPRAAASTAIAITAASANIAEVDVHLPDDWDCVRYATEVSAIADLLPADAVFGECEQEPGDDSAEVSFEGPFRLDLLTGESVPSLDNLVLPPGAYSRVDVEFDEVEDDLDDPMAGYSLLARGVSTIDGVTRPVDLALAISEEMRFGGASAFHIGVTGGADIVVAISAAQWFAGVDEQLATCVLNELALPETAAIVLDDANDNDCTDEIADRIETNLDEAGQVQVEAEADVRAGSSDDPQQPEADGAGDPDDAN